MCWARYDVTRQPVSWAQRSPRRADSGADDLRISDAERQATIEQLRRHTAEGRLTLEEFEERVGETLESRTGAELHHVLRDLPAPPAPRPARVVPWVASPLVVAAVALVAVSLVVGHLVVWPLFVAFGFWAFGGCCSRGRVTGERSLQRNVASHRSEPLTTV